MNDENRFEDEVKAEAWWREQDILAELRKQDEPEEDEDECA